VRVKTRPLEGEAATWDPADPEPFVALTGTQFIGVEGEMALVRNRGGCVHHVHRGWLAIKPDGSGAGETIISSPENYGPGRLWDEI
jgi:hypothetical protein